MAKHNFSILCWNIAKNSNEQIKEYICEKNADIYFLQEAVIGQVGYKDEEKRDKKERLRIHSRSKEYETLYLQEKSTAKCSGVTKYTPLSSNPGSPAVCNCIIYNSKKFEIYKVQYGTNKVHCAIEVITIKQAVHLLL